MLLLSVRGAQTPLHCPPGGFYGVGVGSGVRVNEILCVVDGQVSETLSLQALVALEAITVDGRTWSDVLLDKTYEGFLGSILYWDEEALLRLTTNAAEHPLAVNHPPAVVLSFAKLRLVDLHTEVGPTNLSYFVTAVETFNDDFSAITVQISHRFRTGLAVVEVRSRRLADGGLVTTAVDETVSQEEAFPKRNLGPFEPGILRYRNILSTRSLAAPESGLSGIAPL